MCAYPRLCSDYIPSPLEALIPKDNEEMRPTHFGTRVSRKSIRVGCPDTLASPRRRLANLPARKIERV